MLMNLFSVGSSVSHFLRRMSTSNTDNLVMYIILRKDLIKLPNWNTGALITQGAHASTACVWENKDDPDVQTYLSPENINHMHKVTLAAPDDASLQQAIEILKQNSIVHRVWREDDMDVCVAVKPTLRSVIKPILSGFKLYR